MMREVEDDGEREMRKMGLRYRYDVGLVGLVGKGI